VCVSDCSFFSLIILFRFRFSADVRSIVIQVHVENGVEQLQTHKARRLSGLLGCSSTVHGHLLTPTDACFHPTRSSKLQAKGSDQVTCLLEAGEV
jgi:hypothetical protein